MSNEIKDLDESEKNLTKEQLQKKRTFEYLIGHQKYLQNKTELEELSVKQSKLKNAGQGLFTNIDIPKNNIICFYPVKLMQDLEFPDLFYKDGVAEPFTPELNKKNKQLIYNSDYNIQLHPFRIITDDYIPDNQIYLGHIANDRGYHPEKTYKPQLNNCRFEGMNLVSCKDIKAGEELFTTYGKNYWFNDNHLDKDIIIPSRHKQIKSKQ